MPKVQKLKQPNHGWVLGLKAKTPPRVQNSWLWFLTPASCQQILQAADADLCSWLLAAQRADRDWGPSSQFWTLGVNQWVRAHAHTLSQFKKYFGGQCCSRLG